MWGLRTMNRMAVPGSGSPLDDLDDVSFLRHVWRDDCAPLVLPGSADATPEVRGILETLGLPVGLGLSPSPERADHSLRIIAELTPPLVEGTKLKIGIVDFLRGELASDLFVDLRSGRVEKAFRRRPASYSRVADSIVDFHFQLLLYREFVTLRAATEEWAGLLLQVLAAFSTTISAPHSPFGNRMFMSLADGFILELDWDEPAQVTRLAAQQRFAVSAADVWRVAPHQLAMLCLYGDLGADARRAVRDVQAARWPDDQAFDSNSSDIVSECLRALRNPADSLNEQWSLLDEVVGRRWSHLAREYGLPESV